MITKLSHVTLFVTNQEAAKSFYVEKLGFNVHTDHTMDNGFRWLTVTAPDQPDLEIVLLEPVLFDSPKDSVELAACLDVSRVEVRDKNGASLVDPDRIDVQTLTVSVVPDAASETGLLVTAIGPRESEPSCSQ